MFVYLGTSSNIFLLQLKVSVRIILVYNFLLEQPVSFQRDDKEMEWKPPLCTPISSQNSGRNELFLS